MNTIGQDDLQILSRYKFIEDGSNKQNTHLIGLKWIKEGSEWKQKLVEINKSDVSCGSLFLSYFGLGKLKNITVSLNTVCSYLSKHQWKEIKPNEEEPYKAFKTVCHLANRQMLHYRRFQLFKAVSDSIQSEFYYYWNPAMNGRFLLSLQDYYLSYVRNVGLRFKDSKLSVLSNQMLSKDDMANVEVGYSYYQERIGKKSYCIGYPVPPYYSTACPNTRKIPED